MLSFPLCVERSFRTVYHGEKQSFQEQEPGVFELFAIICACCSVCVSVCACVCVVRVCAYEFTN
jgi:hypothetical protein